MTAALAVTRTIKSHTYTNKRGQTVLCERSGMVYSGLRHRLNRLDATAQSNNTIDIFAHRQENVGWRLLCITNDHDIDETTASYVGKQYETLQEILDDSENILESIGYL